MTKAFAASLRSRYAVDDGKSSISEWIVANTTLRGRPFSFDKYSFQKQIADDPHANLVCRKCSQVGLALALDTPVPTTTGWTSMGEVQVGDELFDEAGQPCRVTYVSPIYTDHDCYRITFDDGETIVADAGHRWYVELNRAIDLSGKYAGRGRPSSGAEMFKSGVLDTRTIAAHFKKGCRNQFAVPNTKALQGSEVPLPLDPYFLGLWLGDGNSHACVITTHKDDAPFYEQELARRGLVCLPSSERGDTLQFRVHFPGQVTRPGRGMPASVSAALESLALGRGVKHIPSMYLRASAPQRLDLVRGLMDTDGSVTKNGRCSFYNSNPDLVSGFEELAHSLGWKTRTRWRWNEPSTMKSGHVITPRHPVAEVSFAAYAEDAPTLLPRKVANLRRQDAGRPTEALRRRIVSVEAVEPVPVRCLTVDSPNHLFLTGRGMVPTHNTETQLRKYLALLVRTSGITGIFTLPSDDMFGRVWDTRLKPMLDTDRVFQPPEGQTWVKRKGLFSLGYSNGIVTGCGEDDATSTPADFLMHDELDLSPQNIIALYQSRVQNSDYKIRQQFSTPTHVDYGVDGLYKLSDQHVYLVKCASCGHHQLPEFTPTFVRTPNAVIDRDFMELSYEEVSLMNFSDAYVACEKCNAPLPLGDGDAREWVPEFPERQNIRGYDVTPFTNDRISIKDIFRQLGEYRRLDNPRGFMNTVMGRAYAGDNARLKKSDIEACISYDPPDIPKDAKVYLGIDLGLTCHLALGVRTPKGPLIFHWETVKAGDLKERVLELKQQYPRLVGGGDRVPYTTEIDAIRDATQRAVWPVHYSQPNSPRIRQVKDETGEVNHYQANRTMAIDQVANAIRGGRIGFANLAQLRTIVIEHLLDMVRDEQPEKPAVWLKLTGNDHFFHVLAFLLFSMKIEDSDEYFSDAIPQTILIADGSSGWSPPRTSKSVYNPFNRN